MLSFGKHFTTNKILLVVCQLSFLVIITAMILMFSILQSFFIWIRYYSPVYRWENQSWRIRGTWNGALDMRPRNKPVQTPTLLSLSWRMETESGGCGERPRTLSSGYVIRTPWCANTIDLLMDTQHVPLVAVTSSKFTIIQNHHFWLGFQTRL